MMGSGASRPGGGGGFPTTRGSALVGARSDDPAERARSFEALVAAYWKPVYKYLRFRFRRSPEDAKDLTQGFFLRALEKNFFAPYDATRGRFRTFLRTCLDGYAANELKAAGRLKRGGDAIFLSLEFERADGEMARCDPPDPGSLDRYFDSEWARSLFELGVEGLRLECGNLGKQVHFLIFEAYDLEPGERRPTYDQLAERFSLPATTVTNHLAWARREFRRIVLERLREITGTDDEFRREARVLLGVEME